jgi:hypothetical protein
VDEDKDVRSHPGEETSTDNSIQIVIYSTIFFVGIAIILVASLIKRKASTDITQLDAELRYD